MKQKMAHDDEWAYVYVIKNPSYNDVCLCAWDSVLYAGTPIVYETRFGLDLGIVVGPAPVPGKSYVPGRSDVHGACLHFSDEKEEDAVRYVSDDSAHQCDSCFCCQIAKEPEKMKVDGSVTWIDHLATPAEMSKYAENEDKEEEALRICREKIRKHEHKTCCRRYGWHFSYP